LNDYMPGRLRGASPESNPFPCENRHSMKNKT